MFTANRTNFDYSPERIVACASDIGFAPGQWPDMLAIVDDNNEGFLLFRSRMIGTREDLVGFEYNDKTGKLPPCTIFND